MTAPRAWNERSGGQRASIAAARPAGMRGVVTAAAAASRSRASAA